MQQKKEGVFDQRSRSEKHKDQVLLDVLGIGLGPAVSQVMQCTSFKDFESWVIENGHIDTRQSLIQDFSLQFDNHSLVADEYENTLSKERLSFFEEHGYLVIPEVISNEACMATITAIADFLGHDFTNPRSWYATHPAKHGIMIEFFKHQQLEENRFSKKIWKAYESLWQTNRLVVSTDRVGFNPPETDFWKFPGPNLHLDIAPESHLSFGLQGILYLTDTAEDQGALTVVPGFHKKINSWMEQFPTGKVPLIEVFDEFESVPIAANAGDFIIWHHGLPHGSSPNQNKSPRIVQYINLYPMKCPTE